MVAQRKRKHDPAKRRAKYLREVARAKALGYSSPSQITRERKAMREGRVFTPRDGSSILRKFGISRKQFEDMRIENRQYTPVGSKKALLFQTYNTEIDERVSDWSEARIGYIVAFNRAVVDESSNFYSIPPSNRWVEEAGPSEAYKQWRETQYLYLVRYGGIYDTEVFDSRYGDGNGSVALIASALGIDL